MEHSTLRIDSSVNSFTPVRQKEPPRKSQFAPKSFTDPHAKEPVKDQIDAIVKVQDLLIDHDIINQSALGRDSPSEHALATEK